MNNVTIIEIDLAKRVFHAHGAFADGAVAFRKSYRDCRCSRSSRNSIAASSRWKHAPLLMNGVEQSRKASVHRILKAEGDKAA